jgi:formate hydrogenlyase subunit 3/multisubunit Na+/H+ antiporter MnhD subunit
MFILIFAVPFAAALLCLGLNNLVQTRWLGLASAGALLVSAAALLLAPQPVALPERIWAMLGDYPVRLALVFDGVSRPLALLALGGGALALLALALAIPPDLRRFGGLFASLLLMLLSTIAGLANQEQLLLPFAWALVVMLSFAALRASGTQVGSNTLPASLLTGFAGALLLLAAATTGVPLGSAALACWALAGLLAFGAPLFHATFEELAAAPAALVGTLLPLGLPLLGGYALIRFVAEHWDAVPPTWRMAWVLLGLLTLLACAAGAAGTSRMRRLIGWQYSAQIGLVLISLGLHRDLPPLEAPISLLINAVLTTLACFLALAVLERRAGTDDLAEIGAHGPLILPGLAFLVAAASAVGFPGTWGWWNYRELLDTAHSEGFWLLALVLAGSALRLVAYAAPLVAFWRASQSPVARRGWPTAVALLCPAIAVLPLLIWGIAPQVAWNGWLVGVASTLRTDIPTAAAPDTLTQIAIVLGALALLALPLVGLFGRQRHIPYEQEPSNAALLTPEALGQSLRGLAWFANPISLYQLAWRALLSLSRGTARLLAMFEQRYYLAGLMIAVIVVVLLMI